MVVSSSNICLATLVFFVWEQLNITYLSKITGLFSAQSVCSVFSTFGCALVLPWYFSLESKDNPTVFVWGLFSCWQRGTLSDFRRSIQRVVREKQQTFSQNRNDKHKWPLRGALLPAHTHTIHWQSIPSGFVGWGQGPKMLLSFCNTPTLINTAALRLGQWMPLSRQWVLTAQ